MKDKDWVRSLLEDLWVNGEDDKRARIDEYHPEWSNLPNEMIPWPYRDKSWPFPQYCPKCGRDLVHWWWGESEYHEVGCAGRLQILARRWPGLLDWGIRHWKMTVGDRDKPARLKRYHYDPVSGQPMDGPPK